MTRISFELDAQDFVRKQPLDPCDGPPEVVAIFNDLKIHIQVINAPLDQAAEVLNLRDSLRSAEQLIQAFKAQEVVLMKDLSALRTEGVALAFLNRGRYRFDPVLEVAKALNKEMPDWREKMIPAIKHIRDTAALGLKESKDLVEAAKRAADTGTWTTEDMASS